MNTFPEDEREVIVELSNGVVTTGHYFSNGRVWRIGGEYTNDVVAWQYLPKSVQPVEQTHTWGDHVGPPPYAGIYEETMMQEQNSKPNPLANIWGQLREAIRLGRVQTPSHRKSPHSRVYTKLYADGRQRNGGKLHTLEQKRVVREHKGRHFIAPQPSAHARRRAGKRRSFAAAAAKWLGKRA